jgi:transposase
VDNPREHPWRLALVTEFQFVEGLSDSQAAEAVRARIDVKYLLSLPLADPGFDASVLSEFRSRLVAGGAERRRLVVLLEQCQARGWRKRAWAKAARILPTCFSAVRALNRLEMVGETLRHARQPSWPK